MIVSTSLPVNAQETRLLGLFPSALNCRSGGAQLASFAGICKLIPKTHAITAGSALWQASSEEYKKLNLQLLDVEPAMSLLQGPQ